MFAVTSRAWTILSSLLERKCPYCIRRLNCSYAFRKQQSITADQHIPHLTLVFILETNNLFDERYVSKMINAQSLCVFRWQMNLINDPRIAGNKMNTERTKNIPPQETHPPSTNQPREDGYIGPVFVVPTATCIRRLDKKGLLLPRTKNFSLPALPVRAQAKLLGKRKNLEPSKLT